MNVSVEGRAKAIVSILLWLTAELWKEGWIPFRRVEEREREMVEEWFSLSLGALPSAQPPVRSQSSASNSNKQRSSTGSNASGQASSVVSIDRNRISFSKKNLWNENVPNNRDSTNTYTSGGRKSKVSSLRFTSTLLSAWIQHQWRRCILFFKRELAEWCSNVIHWNKGFSTPTSGKECAYPIKRAYQSRYEDHLFYGMNASRVCRTPSGFGRIFVTIDDGIIGWWDVSPCQCWWTSTTIVFSTESEREECVWLQHVSRTASKRFRIIVGNVADLTDNNMPPSAYDFLSKKCNRLLRENSSLQLECDRLKKENVQMKKSTIRMFIGC